MLNPTSLSDNLTSHHIDDTNDIMWNIEKLQCDICPRGCMISPGGLGFCAARGNVDSQIVCANYGALTSIALDPIEKKPLYHFFPGSNILSVGSYGCNLRCPFCQNFSISVEGKDTVTKYVSPEMLVQMAVKAKSDNNIGIAFTYNEPLISFEYIYDCSKMSHASALKNVIVTNGYINEVPLITLLPHIDAMNIDLKCFQHSYYEELGGNLDIVLSNIALASRYTHVEITMLIIPSINDSEQEMDAAAKWISNISTEIPLHISRFFPRYKYSNMTPTPLKTIDNLTNVAKHYLEYVYKGNC